MDKFDRASIAIWAFYAFTVLFVGFTAPNGVTFAVASVLGLTLLALIGPPIRMGGKDE